MAGRAGQAANVWKWLEWLEMAGLEWLEMA